MPRAYIVLTDCRWDPQQYIERNLGEVFDYSVVVRFNGVTPPPEVELPPGMSVLGSQVMDMPFPVPQRTALLKELAREAVRGQTEFLGWPGGYVLSDSDIYIVP